MPKAHVFFDTRDGEWSVRIDGQDYSDLCGAGFTSDPAIYALFEEAYQRNVETYLTAIVNGTD